MLVMLKKAAAAIATPAANKVAIFVDSTSGEPSYKNDAGAVASLKGATGATGATGASGATKPVTALSIASGVVNIDCALGDHFTLTLSANVTSITFTNLPAAGYAKEIAVNIVQDATGSRTVALPAAFKATGGSDTSVAAAASAYTLLTAVTFDQGTRWAYAMQDVAA